MGMDSRKYLDSSLGSIEKGIYLVSAVMLSAAAVVVFGQAVYEFHQHIVKMEAAGAVISLLENILLALMLAELLHTLMVSIESKGLIPEPFLIVALVAAVRRILAISVEGAHLINADVEKFRLVMIEIGILAGLIIILGISIFILRKNKPTATEERPGKSDAGAARQTTT